MTPIRPRVAPLRRGAVLLIAALATTACGWGGGDPTGPIDRETFIATYVDLRLSALGTPTGIITPEERDRVLAKHQVTILELEGFAEVWGADPHAMRTVWEEVQRRLRVAAGEDTTTHTAVPAPIDPGG